MSRVKEMHEACKTGDIEVVRKLLAGDRSLANVDAGSEPSQRNKHGLTALGCAVGGTQGRWKHFSNATVNDWQRTAEIVRAHGGVE